MSSRLLLCRRRTPAIRVDPTALSTANILPDVRQVKARKGSNYARREILHIRHHSLVAPRDFDLSPYFQIIKPHLADGFDHHLLKWGNGSAVQAMEEEGHEEDEAGEDAEPTKEPESARQHAFCERSDEGTLSEHSSR